MFRFSSNVANAWNYRRARERAAGIAAENSTWARFSKTFFVRARDSNAFFSRVSA